MTDPRNTSSLEDVPTVKAFSDLPLPRYYNGYPEEELYEQFERFENYEPGGFCPIDLSFESKPSFINDRFEVIYKLGWGGFGTVWLCYEGAVKKWRAVKVGKGSHTEEHSGEVLVESIMKKHSVGAAEAMENNIVLPLETFWIDSINGKHLCSVLPLLGPTLSDWVECLEEDDPEQAQRIVSQMTKGMNFLHHHGICHGDFRPQNILMQLKDGAFDDIGIDEMCDEILGEPTMVDIILRNGSVSPYSPKTAYSGVAWGSDTLSRFVSDKIAIVDFGEAYLTTNANPRELGIPGSYAAPEIVFGGAKGIGTDIWALAYSILEFRKLCRPLPPSFKRAVKQKLGGGVVGASSEGEQNEKGPESSEPVQATSTPSGPTMLNIIDSEHKEREGKEFDGRLEGFLSRSWRSMKLDRKEIISLGDLLQNLFRWKSEERWDTDKILAHRWFSEKHKAAKTKSDEEDHDNEPETQIPKQQDDTTTNPSNIIDVSDSIPILLGSDTDSQQVIQHQKRAWFYLKLFTMALYGAGIFATMVFFLAHMLSMPPGLYADRRTVSSHEPSTSQLTTVVEYVVITLNPLA
ncbi:kinase-like domain-containing protein [Apiospora kogelbergensis]|uniref:kinase-like domain-containing protein n=1 Tax=Apiospora kogelbergensis TaxID=1337665 RepID=UPI00312E5353